MSSTADDFEDLGKDADALQLRQRRGGAGGVETSAEPVAATASKSDAKKGR